MKMELTPGEITIIKCALSIYVGNCRRALEEHPGHNYLNEFIIEAKRAKQSIEQQTGEAYLG